MDTLPTRVGSSSIGTGRGTGPTGLGLFYQFQIDEPVGRPGPVLSWAHGALVPVWAEASNASTAFIQVS